MSTVHTCQHIKTNGERCQAIALNNSNHCYFHANLDRRQRTSARISRKQNEVESIEIPALEDANAVQVALMETINGLIDGRLSPRLGNLVLGALRTASVNLRHTNFAPDPQKCVTDATPAAEEAAANPQPNVAEQPPVDISAGDGRVRLAGTTYC